MSSANNGDGNAANVASGKRKCTSVHGVGCSSKKVALDLFPTQPTQKQPCQVSQSSGLNHHTNGGGNQNFSPNNFQPFTTGMQLPPEAQDDPFEKLIQSQYEKMRETCEQYLNNKYNVLLTQVEERASRISMEKDLDIAQMRRMITYYEQKLASDNARVEQLNEEINNKNAELDDSRRRNIELEEQVGHYKSQAEVWKAKAESVEEMVWNATMSPRRQAPSSESCEGGV